MFPSQPGAACPWMARGGTGRLYLESSRARRSFDTAGYLPGSSESCSADFGGFRKDLVRFAFDLVY